MPSKTPGDLDLKVLVVLPSAHDPRARQLYEQMATTLPDFDARKIQGAEQEHAAKEGTP